MKLKKILVLVSVIILLSGIGYFAVIFFIKEKEVVIAFENEISELINIDEYTDEQMDTYLEEVTEISNSDNKENMLIVTSKENIIDDNAVNIVAGPNNQYFIEYKDIASKDKAFEVFSNNEDIYAVSENIIYSTYESEISSGTYNSWGIEFTGLDIATAEANIKNLPEVVVAIIDTGLDSTLFNANYTSKIYASRNILDGTSDVTDYDGHGTHIAGTIAEGTPDNVKIFPVKVADDGIEIYNTDVIAAINYIIQDGKTDVINMSFGGNSPDENVNVAIQAGNALNIIMVAAAGNDSSLDPHYPATYENVISVSATKDNNELAGFSNMGNYIDFAAPGNGILSINGSLNGTSMAAPHVASAAAIFKSYDKTYNHDDIHNILRHYAIDLGDVGKDILYGYGLLNLKNIVYCEEASCSDPIEYISYNDENIVKIEINNVDNIPAPSFDFGNQANLNHLKVDFYYEENKYYTKDLFELEGATVTGYNPDSTGLQNLVFKYNTTTINFTINWGDITESAYVYNILEDNTIAITDIKSKEDIIYNLSVPSTIDGYEVSAFNVVYNRLVNVTFPDSVVSIGDNVFKDNSNLKSVTFLAPYVDLGERTFDTAYYLEEINGNIRNFSKYAFFNTDSLKNIDLVDGMTEIPQGAFSASGITSIVLPSTVTSINDAAFASANSLSSITTSQTEPIEIGESTFVNTYELKKLGFDVKALGYNSFAASGIEEITLIEGITSIPALAFLKSNIKNITLPSTVKSIGASAFEHTKSLVTVDTLAESIATYDKSFFGSNISTFNGKLNFVSKYAFYDAVNISDITLDNTITNIGQEAFKNASSLININFPESLEKINGGAFHHTGLEYIYIGANLDQYSYEAFFYNNLKNITVNQNNKNYSDGNNSNVLIDSKFNALVLGSSNSIIPDTVVQINPNAFYGNEYLTNIIIPSSVKYIANNVFAECINLEKLLLPKTLENISPSFLTENLKVGNPKTDILLKVYLDSYAHDFVKTNTEFRYISVDPIRTVITFDKYEFDAFHKIELGDYTMVGFEYETNDDSIPKVETATGRAVVVYSEGNDSLRADDTQVGILVNNMHGVDIISYVDITVNKINPTYNIPTGLTIKKGMNLSDINLSGGFEWINPDTLLNDVGIKSFKAKFIPEDTINYLEVGSLDINVNVVEPNTNVTDNTEDVEVLYDGNFHSITVDLSVPDYKIGYSIGNYNYDLDSSPEFKDVGEYIVNYKATNNIYTDVEDYKTVYIYGIRKFNTGITEKGSSLVVSGFDNGFDSIERKIDIFAKNKNISYYDKSDNLINTSEATTGDKLKININGQKDFMYDLVVLGDVYADSRISALDYISIKNHIMKTNEISDPIIKEAADVNSDSKISALDYITIKNHIMSGGN